jgi:hypothetical protein
MNIKVEGIESKGKKNDVTIERKSQSKIGFYYFIGSGGTIRRIESKTLGKKSMYSNTRNSANARKGPTFPLVQDDG